MESEDKLKQAVKSLDRIFNGKNKKSERITCYALFVGFPVDEGTVVHLISNMIDKTPVVDWAHDIIRGKLKGLN